MRSLTTGGDNCSCLSRQESAMTTVMFDFSQYLRRMYLHQHKVIHEFIKRLQVAGNKQYAVNSHYLKVEVHLKLLLSQKKNSGTQ